MRENRIASFRPPIGTNRTRRAPLAPRVHRPRAAPASSARRTGERIVTDVQKSSREISPAFPLPSPDSRGYHAGTMTLTNLAGRAKRKLSKSLAKARGDDPRLNTFKVDAIRENWAKFQPKTSRA